MPNQSGPTPQRAAHAFSELVAAASSIPETAATDLDALAGATVAVFDTLIDYLRDAGRFPSPVINELATTAWRLIGNRVVPVALYDVPSVHFAVVGAGDAQLGIILLPYDFVDRVRLDPVTQLGALVSTASYVRDYHVGLVGVETSAELGERGAAFEAEALHTVDSLASASGVPVIWDPYQSDLRQRFPRGVADLKPSLAYHNPQPSMDLS